MYDLAIVGGTVYLDGHMERADLYIHGESIAAIARNPAVRAEAREMVDATGLLVFPGIIDPHVHMALKVGAHTSCDDFASGSEAAARGGVTTIIDFLDPIAHEDALHEAFESRMTEAAPCMIDYSFHATLSAFNGNVERLVNSVKALGMNSVKVFTTYARSGRMIERHHLESLLMSDIVTLVHAEDDALVDEGWHDINTYGESRPLESELSALRQLVSMPKKGILYVVHVSSGSGVLCLRGQPNIAIESCPQYFHLNHIAFSIEDGALYLLAPPLRTEAERIKLCEQLAAIDSIGTDHCPFMKAEKLTSIDASEIPKGIGGVQHAFTLMYDAFGIQIVDKMTRTPACIFGLSRKGRIETGYDADLFLFDPARKTNVSAETLGGNCDYTVYEGRVLDGAVVATLSRGAFVFRGGQVHAHKGRFVKATLDHDWRNK